MKTTTIRKRMAMIGLILIILSAVPLTLTFTNVFHVPHRIFIIAFPVSLVCLAAGGMLLGASIFRQKKLFTLSDLKEREIITILCFSDNFDKDQHGFAVVEHDGEKMLFLLHMSNFANGESPVDGMRFLKISGQLHKF